MKILIYSYNDKIGDGLQKITFIQKLKSIYPESHITYTTTKSTSLKTTLNSLIVNCIEEFIEFNDVRSSFFDLFKTNKNFINKRYDLIIDLQKVVLRTLNLKKIPHNKFFSSTANFLFSDFKNDNQYLFKNIYIEKLYFNILNIISNKYINEIPHINIPNNLISKKRITTELNKNIGIAPGAGSELRQWDFDKYLAVGKYLRQKGFNIYFFLGPKEKRYLDVCVNNDFICPEWENDKMISNDITFTMSLAKNIKLLLCNDGGTSWMFEFAGVKTFKIFGITNAKKFARPGYSETIQVQDYGYSEIKDFPLTKYKEILDKFLEKD